MALFRFQVVELLPKTEPEEEEAEVSAAPGKIVMDAVSEYCRGLGDIPTYGMAGNREDVDDDDLIDVERDKEPSTSRMVDDEEDDDDKSERGGWYERDINDQERARSVSPSAMVRPYWIFFLGIRTHASFHFSRMKPHENRSWAKNQI